MALYHMYVYALSDFTTLDFGTVFSAGSIVTGPTVDPILIVVDDDDTNLNNGDATPPTIDSAPAGSGISAGDTLTYSATYTNELSTVDGLHFVQVTIGGTSYVAVANGGNLLQPNTTYSEVVPSAALTSSPYSMWGPVCFANGTRIATDRGETPVERLRIGDLVKTRDGRLVPVRWIGSRALNATELAADRRVWPVRIQANALADGMPRDDLLVSQQHRVLVRSRIVKRMFGVDEVLVPAKKLLPLPGVELIRGLRELTYYHILCDRHEVLISNGAYTESLFTGREALKSLGPESRREIALIFPELLTEDHKPAYATHVPRKQGRLRRLVQRQVRNATPLYA